ncbi:tripartite tricarboxylate transporter substrate binding protein [Bordetella sp. BOR01]|uniref:Bug family tripartite tricarboxylate transporter substrate binding protein n=1 Tax=Bordetella sp. BOR01 TaxID=2854779 RepID=UPI001C470DDB|nr:tripartite tricarboxylate transporter substrate binding protein [Bordetella sp. BOR01]MBV7485053.1 tripartite tricarboxylate transporter substrate binding protein [Bordetella sp. BOR01]
MNIRQALLCAAALAVAPLPAQAGYPAKPIHIIVGAAAGGPTDQTARIVGERMASELGVPVVAQNIAGGGGSLGAAAAARAQPDGYTLLMGTISTHGANPSLYKQLNYDAIKDFTPISTLVTYPLVVVINPRQVPARTLDELIRYAKAHPGKLNRGSAGVGTSMHLSGELFDSMAGIKTTHVAYKGSAPSMKDLVGGQIDLSFESLAVALPHIQSGRLLALAVTGEARSPLLPDVPTVADTLPGYRFSAWLGLVAPAGTPATAIATLNGAVRKALADPAVIAALQSQAAQPAWSTSEAFGELIASDIARLRDLIKTAGIAPQ